MNFSKQPNQTLKNDVLGTKGLPFANIQEAGNLWVSKEGTFRWDVFSHTPTWRMHLPCWLMKHQVVSIFGLNMALLGLGIRTKFADFVNDTFHQYIEVDGWCCSIEFNQLTKWNTSWASCLLSNPGLFEYQPNISPLRWERLLLNRETSSIAVIFFGIQSFNQRINMWTISLDCFFGGSKTAKPTLHHIDDGGFDIYTLRTCRSRHGDVHPHPAPWGIRSDPLNLTHKSRRKNQPSCEMYIRVPSYIADTQHPPKFPLGSDLTWFLDTRSHGGVIFILAIRNSNGV